MSFFQILLILRRVFRRVKFGCHFFSYRSLLLSTSVLNDIYIICMYVYRISRNIDSDFNLAIWRTRQDRQINLRHYRSIYTTSMGFSPHRTKIRQFKIPPTATAKYNVHQYFCLYGNTCRYVVVYQMVMFIMFTWLRKLAINICSYIMPLLFSFK